MKKERARRLDSLDERKHTYTHTYTHTHEDAEVVKGGAGNAAARVYIYVFFPFLRERTVCVYSVDLFFILERYSI